MSPLQRRDLMKKIGAGTGAAAVVSFSGCMGSEDDGPSDAIYGGPFLVVEDALDLVPVQLGVEENIWSDHGLDLEIKVSSFGEWSRAITSGSSDLGGANQAMFSEGYMQDYDLRAFGSCLLQINDIFVRPDSDIESPADLEGRPVGVPFWESGTTMAMQAAIQDEYGLSLREDTDGVTGQPPVLWELLVEQEEIDAMIQFTGQTIQGYANPDTVRPIFDISQYWQERTGHPLEVTYFVARNEWLQNNYEAAYEFIQAWSESLDALADDPRDAYNRFGMLAGLSDESEIDVAVERFENGQVHNTDPSTWNKEYVDAQFDFLNLMQETGVVDEAPPREWGITYSQLEEEGQ